MLAVKMLNNHMVHALITKGVEISTTDSEGRVMFIDRSFDNPDFVIREDCCSLGSHDG